MIKLNKKITIETLLYLAALILAVSFRLVKLDAAALNNQEAVSALQALRLSHGEFVSSGSEPLIMVWNAILFFFTGSSSFWTRFFPAMFGSALVLIAPMLRNQIGKVPALVLAYLIAVDPSLIAGSRQVSGWPLALFGLLAGLAFLYHDKIWQAALSFAIGLLGGTSLWLAILVGLICFTWEKVSGNEIKIQIPVGQARQFAAWFFGGVLLLGSGFFLIPNGLTAIGTSFVNFISAWGNPAQISPSQIIVAIFSSATVWIFFGVWEIWDGIKTHNPFTILCARFIAAGLLILLVYPGREVIHVSLVTIPLMVLAAKRMSRFLFWRDDNPLVLVGISLIDLALILFLLYNLMRIFSGQPGLGENPYLLRWLSISAGMALLILVSLLIAWGWSETLSPRAVVVGILLGLSLFQGFSTWGATGLGRRPEGEIWWRGAWIRDADLLQQTIGDIALWNTGERDGLQIVVAGVQSPALTWQLRNLKPQYETVLAAAQQPDIVITYEQDSLGLSAAYTGQDFIWESKPAWSLMMPFEWIEWMVSRNAPYQNDTLVLWVRSDLVPGENSSIGQGVP